MNSKSILIIDDEAPMRYLLERQLCRAGYGVHVAPDGACGLAMAVERRPDLIVLDIMMPDMDGFEVCERLKAQPATAGIPVVFLSASVDSERRQRAFSLGAADVLSKPLSPGELATAIQGVLRQGAEAQEKRGRVVGFFGLTAPGMSSPAAIALAQTVPTKSNWRVLLVDLEQPFGNIASRLGLAPRPDAMDIIGWRGKLTGAAILDAAQPYRRGLHVLPSPAPRQGLEATALVARMGDVLETLVAEGFYVILNLGTTLTELALHCMERADLVCVVTTDEQASSEYESFLRDVAAANIDADRFIPVVSGGAELPRSPIPTAPKPVVPAVATFLQPSTGRPLPSNLSQLAAALF